jgi:transposase
LKHGPDQDPGRQVVSSLTICTSDSDPVQVRLSYRPAPSAALHGRETRSADQPATPFRSKPGARITRYELADYEWATIKLMLPNKPRGVPRVNDRRVLNGIFWVLRSGAPWRDLPEAFGPYTTCYNRFVRWRRAGVWSRIIDALAAAHDPAVQMIDTSIVRVHQHGACITRNLKAVDGTVTGRVDQKNSCSRG